MSKENQVEFSLFDWLYEKSEQVNEANAISTGGGNLQSSGNVSGTSGIPVGFDADREKKLWGKKFKSGEPKTASLNLKQKTTK